jgi:hypothetical protein
MRILIFLGLFGFYISLQAWEIKRNPFVVSKDYMDQTGKHYLVPKDTYAFLNISVQGIFYKNGEKTVLLDLGDKGLMHLKEGEISQINTPDITSTIYIEKIAESYVLISTNGGEAIRHEVK